jgi:hypothetical protein
MAYDPVNRLASAVARKLASAQTAQLRGASRISADQLASAVARKLASGRTAQLRGASQVDLNRLASAVAQRLGSREGQVSPRNT